MDNSIKERVVAVLKHIGMNVNRASKYLGVPQRTLNRQVNEGGNISMEIVYAILNNVPEISPAWPFSFFFSSCAAFHASSLLKSRKHNRRTS